MVFTSPITEEQIITESRSRLKKVLEDTVNGTLSRLNLVAVGYSAFGFASDLQVLTAVKLYMQIKVRPQLTHMTQVKI